MIDFGNRLKDLRTKKGLSQEQLAHQLGVTKSMISAYETSMRMPSYRVLIKIALLFNVSTDYLLGIEKGASLRVSGITSAQSAILSELIEELKHTQK